MFTTNCSKFKGEIESYLRIHPKNPDVKFNDGVFGTTPRKGAFQV